MDVGRSSRQLQSYCQDSYRKACEKKRQILGLPMEPQNAPRVKKLKKERPSVTGWRKRMNYSKLLSRFL